MSSTDLRGKYTSAEYKEAADLFNQKPKKGVESLIKSNLLEAGDAQELALVLHYCGSLSKKEIGQFLGEPDEFNLAVLQAYCGHHDFAGMGFDDALRKLLLGFRLPGEAQKVERVMDAFAQRFTECNPELFKNKDVAFVLAFSTIMLNTDLHNPQVKNKMSLEEFLRNNRGINDGEDLPSDFMENLFHRIQQNEIRLDDDSNTTLEAGESMAYTSCDKEGWLNKQGGRVRTWKRRWFVLNDNCLYYFRTPPAWGIESTLVGIIPLQGLHAKADTSTGPTAFKVCPQQESSGGLLKALKSNRGGGHHTRYLMVAKDAAERDEWIASITKSINEAASHQENSAVTQKVQTLLGQLCSDDEGMRANASKSIADLTTDELNRRLIIQNGSVNSLILLVRGGSNDVQRHAARALSNIGVDDLGRKAIYDAHGLKPLISLLSASNDQLRYQGAWSLANLTANEEMSLHVARADGVRSLVGLLQSFPSVNLMRLAMSAMANLCYMQENHPLIVQHGGDKLLEAYRTSVSDKDVGRQVTRAQTNLYGSSGVPAAATSNSTAVSENRSSSPSLPVSKSSSSISVGATGPRRASVMNLATDAVQGDEV